MPIALLSRHRVPGGGRLMPLAAALLAALFAVVTSSSRAEAMRIQEVRSPGGINAWLV
jgi:hypothetical protein